MKRLKHIVSWTLWTAVAVYVSLTAVVWLPPVQSFLGRQAALALGRKLGTEVSVGRISLGLPGRIIIDNVSLSDQQQQEMLCVGRLSVKADLLPLLEGRFVISSAQLFGAHATLWQASSDSPLNCQFAIDSLASSDTTSNTPLHLRINTLIIRHSSVTYDCDDALATPGRFNTNHLNISDISSHISLKTLTDDSLNLVVKRLALREQSGLDLQRLALTVEANRQGALLTGMSAQLPRSRLAIDTLTATFDARRLSETLTIRTATDGTTVTPSDLAFLLPQLRPLDQPLAIVARLLASPQSARAERLSVSGNGLSLQLRQARCLLAGNGSPAFTVPDAQLTVEPAMMEQLKQAFPTLPDHLLRLGTLRLQAEAEQQADGQLAASGHLTTDLGSLTASTHSNTAMGRWQGHVQTDSLDLGRLLGETSLGTLATALDVRADSGRIAASGTVERLQWNGYDYSGITIDGHHHQHTVSGHIAVSDPHLRADVEGSVSLDSRTAVRMTGIVSRLDPQALNLSDRWGDMTFAAIVDADIAASTLNDAEGTVDLDDLVMGDYRLDNLHVKSGYDDEKRHFLKVSGDMGEAELRGQFDWVTLPQSFINYTASRLPTLPGLPKTRSETQNDFDISLLLEDADWMQALFGIPLRLERPLHLEARLNDHTREMDISGQLPAFTYDGSAYRGAHIDLSTQGDTTLIDATLTRLSDNGRSMDLTLSAQAADNELTTHLLWDDHTPNRDPLLAISGQMSAITQLYTNEQHRPEAHVRVQPSQMMVHGTPWQLAPCDILYAERRLMVDRFALTHADQHLTIDGIASTSAHDTLTVDLKEIEVEYVLDLVDFHSVEFAGLATGQARATRLFGSDFSAWADLTVSDFHFQQGRMGTLLAHAEWASRDKQIDLEAVVDDGAESQTFIDGYISPVRSDIDLYIRALGTRIAFCNSFTSGVLTDIQGQATGELELDGTLKQLNLTGLLTVDGQLAVPALGTAYEMRGDTICFADDDIQFVNVRAWDSRDHAATVSGGVHHHHLKDFTFDIDVAADDVLAFNFPDFSDGTIYGTVYATGQVDIHGRPGETVINCDVSPMPGSTFGYNAANPDAISQQEFITWSSSRTAPSAAAATPGASTSSPTAGDLRINFLINATPDATLRLLMDQQTGDYITLNGTGSLRATYYNKGPFQMFGNYNVDYGTYGITIQNIIRKNFTFQQGGTIVFGGDPFEASLNLQAVHTVNGVSLSDLGIGNSFSNNTVRVNCLMNILGTAGQPRVEFDLDMPTVNAEETQMIRSLIASEQELNQQVVYLLGIGRFYTQTGNNAGVQQEQQYGQTSLAMQSLVSGTVSSQINEVLSQVIKSDDWNFGANISTGNEGWHNAEYEGMVSGRMLNNRLLINGQFGYRDNATQATPSFIGDFDLRYLLTPSGSLSVKVYNQTNDRYFTRSSLNTQGVGLIMKKDFNNLRDLFHVRKRRPASQP